MSEQLLLALLCVWGVAAGALLDAAQPLANRLRRQPLLLWLWRLCFWLLLLVATALVLLAVSGGALGLYGLPALILGYILYRRLLRRPLRALAEAVARPFRPFFRLLLTIARWPLRLLLWPLALAVRGLERFCRWCNRPFVKKIYEENAEGEAK